MVLFYFAPALLVIWLRLVVHRLVDSPPLMLRDEPFSTDKTQYAHIPNQAVSGIRYVTASQHGAVWCSIAYAMLWYSTRRHSRCSNPSHALLEPRSATQ